MTEVGFTTWNVWGTTVAIGTEPSSEALPAEAIVRREIASFDAACNRFRPDSELSRVNGARGERVVVSSLFVHALQVALDAAERSGGAVDPTVGNALEALGYDRDYDVIAADEPSTPLSGAPAAVAGWRSVTLDPVARTVQLPPGVHLDLGATAKALCVDMAATAVSRQLGVGVLVDVGGDLAMSGAPPADGWRVSVMENSRTPDLSDDCVVAVRGGGMASSGTSARIWSRSGRSFHHIIDPRTGWPSWPVWSLVTVAAGSCVDANVASTAAVVWGEDGPFELAQLGLAGRLVHRDGSVMTVGGWPDAAPAPAIEKRGA